MLRYLTNTDNVDADNKDNTPVLLYTGNEGPVTGFWDASGFVTDTLAKEFKAAVLFVEHRYYGTSIPRNDKIYAYSTEGSQFLTVE